MPRKPRLLFLSGEERGSRGLRCGGLEGRRPRLLTSVCPCVPMLASTAPVVVGKKPGKRPAWDLKGQLCDLNEELKRYREKTQTLDQENQGLREQLREVQEQATALGTERDTLEGELASIRTQAEQGQQKLGTLSARVSELEECLGTKERLLQELQEERLQLQEERSTLSTQLEELEVRLDSQAPCLPEAMVSSSLEGPPLPQDVCTRLLRAPGTAALLCPAPHLLCSQLPLSLLPCVSARWRAPGTRPGWLSSGTLKCMSTFPNSLQLLHQVSDHCGIAKVRGPTPRPDSLSSSFTRM